MKTTHLKIEFTFGTGLDKDARGIPRGTKVEALSEIDQAALRRFGGSTRASTFGTWFDMSENRAYHESGGVLSVVVPAPRTRTEEKLLAGKVESMAFVIKLVLNQASVMVVTTPVNLQMV